MNAIASAWIRLRLLNANDSVPTLTLRCVRAGFDFQETDDAAAATTMASVDDDPAFAVVADRARLSGSDRRRMRRLAKAFRIPQAAVLARAFLIGLNRLGAEASAPSPEQVH